MRRRKRMTTSEAFCCLLASMEQRCASPASVRSRVDGPRCPGAPSYQLAR
jgi:hypothetical protein